jgi:prepilin-type processing-associated H-X9-DG protein/prepilin-type N-terminal cleavage/methylation domain-containing protein
MVKRAFSLVELLVVVAVMALLISMLLPVLSGARQAGRQAVCSANLRSVLLAVQLYLQESGDWLPAAEPPLREFPDTRHWFMNAALMRQMAIDIPLDQEGVPAGPPKAGSVLVCPSHTRPERWRDGTELPYALSYGVNGTWGLGGRPDHMELRRLIEFTHPSNVLAFTDACGIAVAPGIVLYQGCPRDNFDFRHRERANVAWLDGHVTPVVEDDIPFGMKNRYEVFWSSKEPQLAK